MGFNELLTKFKEWNQKRIAQKKSDDLWNKLHRYHKDGKPAKLRQKDAIAMARAAIKRKKR
jgi:hypothetical protein